MSTEKLRAPARALCFCDLAFGCRFYFKDNPDKTLVKLGVHDCADWDDEELEKWAGQGSFSLKPCEVDTATVVIVSGSGTTTSKAPSGPGIEIGPWLPVTAKEPAESRPVLLFRAHGDGDRRAADLHPVTGWRMDYGEGWILEEGGDELRGSRTYPVIGGDGEGWEPTHYAEITYVDH